MVACLCVHVHAPYWSHASTTPLTVQVVVRCYSGRNESFCGVIINMEIIKLTDVKEYWSKQTTTNLPFFWRVFSRGRFLQIYWMLHVGNLTENTKRAKVQPFLDKIIPLFQQYLTPSRELSIDESVIAFRGKLSFRVYIRGKPHPWGIKAYVLSESCSGYLYI